MFKSKEFFYIVALSLAIFMSGCKKDIDANEDLRINTEINCKMKVIDSGGQEYICEFFNTPEKATNIKFSSPESLKSLCITSDFDKFEFSYNGFKCESNKNFFTESSIFWKIPYVINSFNNAEFQTKTISKKKLDHDSFSVIYYKNYMGNCEICVDDDYNIKKIFWPHINAKVEFL